MGSMATNGPDWLQQARDGWHDRGDKRPAFADEPGPGQESVWDYPGRVQCTMNGEVVRPQAGGFYGGWITDEIVGPFKGDPGTSGW